MTTSFTVNGEHQSVEVDPQKPLLWVLREQLALTGTKFGCGIAKCGACTVHVNGQAVRSCVTPIASVEGQDVTTIEGLGTDEVRHPLQQAWIEHSQHQQSACAAAPSA